MPCSQKSLKARDRPWPTPGNKTSERSVKKFDPVRTGLNFLAERTPSCRELGEALIFAPLLIKQKWKKENCLL